VKFLLDENFPLPLHLRLVQEGFDAEHVIELGLRGVSDADLLKRLDAEPLVFLTNDSEFEDAAGRCAAQIIISRLPQRLPIAQRVEIWLKALADFRERKPAQRLFDLTPDGRIVPWEITEVGKGRIFTRPE
jgi:predicted nuclease of predicted toxin-antitoxin system